MQIYCVECRSPNKTSPTGVYCHKLKFTKAYSSDPFLLQFSLNIYLIATSLQFPFSTTENKHSPSLLSLLRKRTPFLCRVDDVTYLSNETAARTHPNSKSTKDSPFSIRKPLEDLLQSLPCSFNLSL